MKKKKNKPASDSRGGQENKSSPEQANARIVKRRAVPWISGGLVILWCAFVSWSYYHTPFWNLLWKTWEFWPRLVPSVFEARGWMMLRDMKLLALLLWLMILGHGLGSVVLNRLGLDTGEKPGQAALSLAAGWGIMALGMLGLGLLKMWDRRVLLSVLAAGTIALIIRHLKIPRKPGKSPPVPAGPEKAEERTRIWKSHCALWLLIAAFFAAFNLFCAFSPETFYDALVYHLALPDLYWKHGGITATPGILYSGLPQLIENLYGIALPLGGDGLARLINLTFGLGSALLTCVIALRFTDRSTACLAALLFYSMPYIATLSCRSGVEPGWTFFQLSALYALTIRLTGPLAPAGWTVLGGILTGFAMGTKYQAWPALVILSAALARQLPAGKKEKFKETALFAGISLLVLSPWILKNIILYLNPVYPFFHEYFSAGPLPEWRALLLDGGGRNLRLTISTWQGLKSYLLYPWSATFQFNGLGPVLLLGFPLLFLRWHITPAMNFLRVSFLGIWFALSLTSTEPRFLLPYLPIACILYAAALGQFGDRRIKIPLYLGLLYVFCSNFMLAAYEFRASEAEAAVLGTQSSDEYLKSPHRGYPWPPYAAIQFVNAELPLNARVLFLGEARGFYCRRDYITTTLFDGYPLREWVRRSADAAELLAFFRQAGVTHILVNRNELLSRQSRSDKSLSFSPEGEKTLADFQNRFLRLVFEDKGRLIGNSPSTWNQVYKLIP